MKKIFFLLILIIPIVTQAQQPNIEMQKLLSSDGVAEDEFGKTVSISNNYAIIGAHFDDDNGENFGSAYIFFNNNGIWEQTTKLIASDAGEGDEFGYSVCIYGDYAIVGAFYHDGIEENTGAAYIFHNNSGIWTEIQKITASDGDSFDYFGWSVGITDNYAIIGAFIDEDNGNYSGSAYIFQNISGTWTQTNKLLASDGAEDDQFGFSVDISGDYAVVGAFCDGDGDYFGSAYVFYNNSTTWTEVTRLTAFDAADSDQYGISVAIFNDNIVVGSFGDDDNGSNSGSAYVYHNNSGNWDFSDKILASDGGAVDLFGFSVDISENIIIVGAHQNNDNGSSSGSAYLFQNNAGTWTQTAKLIASDASAGDEFAYGVSISGNFAVIGAIEDDDNGNNSGSAYIFAPFPNISTQPLDQNNICPETIVHFSIEGEGIETYQWHVSDDNGNNWTNLSDDDTYTGTTTNLLSVTTDINMTLNNYQYSCTVTNDYGSITSNTVVLTFDTELPTMTCPSNQVVYTDETTNTYIVSGIEFDLTDINDNCSIFNIENDLNFTETLNGEEFTPGTYIITWTVTDIAENTANCEFVLTVNEFVGISDFSKTEIFIFPNPTTGIFEIKNERLKIKNIDITDLTGKIIYNSTSEYALYNMTRGHAPLQMQIDISNQPTGIYFIKIQTEDFLITKKIIKN